jgi:DNA invertase Pin-like site-specific DNA recombinase
MNRHPKIQPQHLERQVYVYVRQSTPQQVKRNLESQDLQYQLAQRAEAFGWKQEQVVIIDDDLGKTAITVADRNGFQTLVVAVGLARVGLILVTDVSRLARNCSDWYHLLDLAAMFGTLIGDGQEVYDPRDYNDRLLLGLKGTLSEAQWYQMRTQLYSALLNKARRGEFAIRLPVGYDRDAEGQVAFCPNQAVQSAIRLVFEQFEGLGSARKVLLYFYDHGLELPRRIPAGPGKDEIEWAKPSYQAIYRILTHPAYAGAYTYGKRQSTRLPGAGKKIVVRVLPLEEWEVLRRDAFPGYITWECYLRNRERLRENAQGVNWSKGAARQGGALLQGIVVCGRCGRRLHTRYSNQPAYVCEVAASQYGEATCQNFMVPHIDEAVTRVFLEAVQPAHLEVALATLEEVEAQRQQAAGRWQQQLERAHYEADLARRYFERVDPDNRLVAAELERRWEEKLQTCRRLEQEWDRVQKQELAPLTEEDRALIRRLAEDISALWQAETTTNEERKRLLRCLIRDVTLDGVTKPGVSIIRIQWHTGTTTVVEAERPRSGRRTSKEIVERVRELAQHHPDDEIAGILNRDGVRTAMDNPWDLRRVENVRKKYKIPTACPYFTRSKGPRGDGLLAAPDAAERLGTTSSTVAYWFRQGLIVGHQRGRQAALWVRLTDDDVKRLNGSARLTSDMVPVGEAPQALGITKEKMHEEIRAGRLLAYRLFVRNRWRWYVQLPAEPPTLATKP